MDLRILQFKNNPRDTRLFDHDLRKRMNGQKAFSIDNDVRIVYRQKKKNLVQFMDLGGHEEVYDF